jgi:thioredoxin-related protein
VSQQLFDSPASISKLLAQARTGTLVVAGLYSSDRCPWCVALKNEQLAPRIRGNEQPVLRVVEFNADSRLAFSLPDLSKKTATQWAAQFGFRVMPTLVMLNQQGQPLGEALIGYGSPDFYAAYLEERIKAAHTYWQAIAS